MYEKATCLLKSESRRTEMGSREELRRKEKVISISNVLREVNTDSVKSFLTQDCMMTKFKLNVPSAAHTDGIIMRAIYPYCAFSPVFWETTPSNLKTESLQTLFTEAESAVNRGPPTMEKFIRLRGTWTSHNKSPYFLVSR